jgi:hypothetical protein
MKIGWHPSEFTVDALISNIIENQINRGPSAIPNRSGGFPPKCVDEFMKANVGDTAQVSRGI